MDAFLTKNLDDNLPAEDKLRFRGFIYSSLIITVVIVGVLISKVYTIVRIQLSYTEVPAIVLARSVENPKMYTVRVLGIEKNAPQTLVTDAQLQVNLIIPVYYNGSNHNQVYYENFFITDYFLIFALLTIIFFIIKGHQEPGWIFKAMDNGG